jgi:homoserine dehydrogenase
VKQIRTIQVGLGLIGGTVVEQITQHRATWLAEQVFDVGVAAILTTRGALIAGQRGFTDDELKAIIVRRREGADLPEIGAELGLTRIQSVDFDLARLGLKRPIVMDAAAGHATANLATDALAAGGAAVYSNKAPLSQPRTEATALWNGAVTGAVRYETTCGAGLPVISTLRSLLATGDRVIEIVGCLSGTLGAIFSDIAADMPFSAAIRSAKLAGYTEPDPRDDLSGLDVARKALILARTIGRELDLTDVAVQSLVPESLTRSSVEEFMERVSGQDSGMSARQAEAAKEGKTLKYVARVPAEGPIQVGIEAVPTSTVLGALQGPENIISIRTERYDRYPLTISGPGAGAAVTAAGMIADLLDLA